MENPGHFSVEINTDKNCRPTCCTRTVASSHNPAFAFDQTDPLLSFSHQIPMSRCGLSSSRQLGLISAAHLAWARLLWPT